MKRGWLPARRTDEVPDEAEAFNGDGGWNRRTRFSGLAVAHDLMAQGWEVRWLGTSDRMEADLVPKHGIEIDFITISGLRGKGIKALLGAPFRIFRAVCQARAIMRNYKPDVVLGMGGYVSGPGGLAAWLCGIPVVLHEPERHCGINESLVIEDC
ncbi:UDP-N-acetylglucosamine--N-acetylmuramyl-(pentapeptide) pyrophosphoryl-undecaprenol N-acetylglucosamine transferase [Budvicia aquatica]|uniref:UDP-N-acetylglucosamine--N-acetylmuramyl-(Pentapeptide) pyrophosphoryl-undecaprenol N-acetylglucosamine transferase n=1 Tax=Budvicia aquatica TaxID=82979 RepID=A0A484ZHL2_9GAMM|nr:UDP-N-acetylglucosamine--N-acetylmuramyl-(pentapeptide) pyrophosphoryl-undecaprenol N-acetylglucosamine transferase [Budvicia aquatica]